MKSRLAKKIMRQRPAVCGGPDGRRHTVRYWHLRWMEWYNAGHPVISFKPCRAARNHRIALALGMWERKGSKAQPDGWKR